MTFKNVLKDVFNGFQRGARFYINVTPETVREDGVVGRHPPIVTFNSAPLYGEARISTPVIGESEVIRGPVILVAFGVSLLAQTSAFVPHASLPRKCRTARTVHIEGGNRLMEFRIHGRVRNFCPHISFVMVGAARAVCRLDDDENVGMRESSFLELKNDEFRHN